MSLIDRLATSTLPLLPRPLMRTLASRYIAGERLEDALQRLAGLRDDGYLGIIDLLGEEIADEDAARVVAQTYAEAAEALAQRELDAYVSVKPTHVGLLIAEELAFELYARLLAKVATLGNFLRVEMEDHTTTTATLRVFERLRREPNGESVGIVLQSRLLRTPEDIDRLAPGPLNVRMVKGVYLEPAEIAHVDPDPIREAYISCCAQLFDRGAFVSFATHDELLAERLIELCRERSIGPDRYEFQVLLGVREKLWATWIAAGHPVRVYVPYGPEWRAYSTRRLRKNPQIFWHVARDLIRRR